MALLAAILVILSLSIIVGSFPREARILWRIPMMICYFVAGFVQGLIQGVRDEIARRRREGIGARPNPNENELW